MSQQVLVTALLVSISYVDVAHAADFRTVALSGRLAPGTAGGVVFDSFESYNANGVLKPLFRGPVLNDAGQIAFRANLAGDGLNSTNNQGVWSEGAGNLEMVTRTGSAAPGGGTFGTYAGLELFTPVINSKGKTAFYGALDDGKLGIWSEGSGSLAVVARDGIHASILPSGVNFSFAIITEENKWIFTDFPLLNETGQTTLYAGLTGTGVNNTNNAGSWSGVEVNSLATIARRGQPAAGLPAGATYNDTQLATSLNDLGKVAFIAYLQGNGEVGLWSGSPGGLSPVARDGNEAPGTTSGVNFRDFFAPMAINSAGQVAFEAWLTGGDVVDGVNDEGLWSNASGSLQLVARRGSQAAGAPAGVNYGPFNGRAWPLLNDAGQIAFHAGIEGAGVDETNNDGIWFGEPGNLALLARLGAEAPETSSEVSFSDLHYPTLNGAGQVAFRANVTGDGVDSTNDRGIWATDVAGDLQLLVRTGDDLEVAPGDIRKLSNVDFVVLTGNGDGRRSAFNNFGQLAFWASFTDGTQGVFVSSAVAHLPGDFNNDATVDAADYVVWRKTDRTQSGYDAWRANFGTSLFTGSGSAIPSVEPLSAAVPEPAGFLLAAIGMCGVIVRRQR